MGNRIVQLTTSFYDSEIPRICLAGVHSEVSHIIAKGYFSIDEEVELDESNDGSTIAEARERIQRLAQKRLRRANTSFETLIGLLKVDGRLQGRHPIGRRIFALAEQHVPVRDPFYPCATVEAKGLALALKPHHEMIMRGDIVLVTRTQ